MNSDGVLQEAEKYFAAQFKSKAFEPGKTYLPASQKFYDFLDFKNLMLATLDFTLTSGPYTKTFERQLADFIQVKEPALFVNSGSSANLIALSSLLHKNDEVITTAAAFPTTVNPIVQNGAIPVFVDVDFDTLNVKIEDVFSAKSSRTRGVILGHTLGNPFRADEIARWCKENDLFFIEDTCDALGAKIGGRFAGGFGDFSTFSFYPAHHISTGEGGAVVSKNATFRKKAASLRDWGRDCWCDPGQDNTCGKRFDWQLGTLPRGYDHKYTYSEIGYNLKATDLQAALGVSQLEKISFILSQRQKNYDFLLKGFRRSKKLQDSFALVTSTIGTQPSWFGFGLHAHSDRARLHITKYLEQKKIGTRPVFAGNITKQPAYQNVDFKISGALKNTDRIMNQSFWLGIHCNLGEPELTYILEQLENAPT